MGTKRKAGANLGVERPTRRPKRQRMDSVVCELGHQMPSAEHTIQSFICERIMYPDPEHKDDQLLAVALLSLTDIETLEPVTNTGTTTNYVQKMQIGDSSKKFDETKEPNKTNVSNPKTQVSILCGWLNWASELPMLRRLRSLKIA